MAAPLQYAFQLRKTEFIAERDNSDPDGVSLELLQSTCLLTYPMNRNNVLEGNNLIFLNGAYLTFYNFFQNNKQFGSLVSQFKPIGMVGSNMGKGCVAIVSQDQSQTQLQISIYTYCEDYVPTHSIKKQLKFIDIVMVRSSYIILAVEDLATQQNCVYVLNSKTVTCINFTKFRTIKRLICQDHKIYVLFEESGIYTLDSERSINIEEDIRDNLEHKDKKIDDYCQIDNQTKIILYGGCKLYCYWFQTEKQYVIDFKKHVQNCKGHRLIKIGRNILVAHRNSLIISHFVIGDDILNFMGNHAYPQKLKAGIVSVQSSQDQMHAALAVQIFQREQTKIQNFIFNLSAISKSHKFISPFTRVMTMGADCGTFNTMQNVLSSNAYLLIGSKIFNLFYSTTLQRKKMFNLYEVPRFMTVHPLGYQFLCGFDNMIKFYNKVEKDMQEIWSEQYVCTAAKYSKSGGLVLSCIQDSYTVLVIYDCYNFRRLHNIPVYCMKMYTTKIEWVHNNSALVLSTYNEMIKINIFNGEKLSEFKQNKDKSSMYAVKCIEYDTYCDKIIAGTNVSTLVIASKNQNSGHVLNSIKTVNFTQDITCIKINHGLKSIFFGGKSGILYWCSYPLKIKNAVGQQQSQISASTPVHNIQSGSFAICQDISQLKLHNIQVASIDFTNNNKFMLINIKSQGYFKCRVRKLRTKQNSASINVNAVFQELGNPILNTIDISSSAAYSANKDKLKIALEKRKECFNDLEEFRRQWELRLAMTSKQIQVTSKKDQLQFIVQTLSSIQQVKENKNCIQNNIDDIMKQIQEQKTLQQQNYVKKMLYLYEESAKRNQILQNKKNQYDGEFNKLVKDCEENLIEISKDLQQKRKLFQKNYRGMLKNLQNFKKRHAYQKQQQSEQRKIEIKQYLKNLQIQQIQLNKLTNDLSVKITQSKKQYERYCCRKAFLEHKNRFFEQENYNCQQQKKRLEQLKQKLQRQLKELEVYTDKKQKKLKIYLQANQSLRKYKQIHQNMTENAHRQTQFIKEEKQKVDKNIVQVQKELSIVASSNQEADKEIDSLEIQIQKMKRKNYHLNIKSRDVGFYLNQILAAMENVGFCKDQNLRTEKLKQIYQHFYVQRSVQALIQKQNRNQLSPQSHIINQRNQKLKIQQTKILNQLNDQKQYIMSNIQMFKNYNKRVNQQINLNFLQIQAQNYNLIAECNLRKQQTSNKKKMLHELIDSVKETQIYLDEMKRQGDQSAQLRKRQRKTLKTSNEVPFILYQRAKEQKAEILRVKSSEQSSLTCSRTNLHNSNAFIHSHANFRPTTHKIFDTNNKYHIKKMLDIKGYCALPQQKTQYRRIQTATNKKKQGQQMPLDRENHGIIKPLTATFKRRHQRQTLKSAFSIKNKSSSKPSTCATYSRGKPSVVL